MFERDDRRRADQAAREALPAALALRKSRDAAEAAEARLVDYDASAEARQGCQAEASVGAMARTLDMPWYNLNASAEIVQAAQSLERTATWAELELARVSEEAKQAIWSDQQEQAEITHQGEREWEFEP